jgi:hypothetical protein
MTTSIKEMRIVVFSAILATACVAYVALAEAQQPCGDVAVATVTAPGKVAAERVLQITASVEAIAAASPTVTVKGPIDLTRLHSEEVYERSIDIQISRLRRKIEVDSSRPKLIKTERGVGYYLDSAVTAIY